MWGLPWNDAARPVKVMISGEDCQDWWQCRTCKALFGGDGAERSARYCHAENQPCLDCGKPTKDKGHCRCQECADKKYLERWLKLEEVDWDGKTPLFAYSSGRYYFQADELSDWIYYESIDTEQTHEEVLEVMQLQLCDTCNPPNFSLDECACDIIPDECTTGDYVDTEAIERVVNDALQTIALNCWESTNKRPSIKSLKNHLLVFGEVE